MIENSGDVFGCFVPMADCLTFTPVRMLTQAVPYFIKSKQLFEECRVAKSSKRTENEIETHTDGYEAWCFVCLFIIFHLL